WSAWFDAESVPLPAIGRDTVAIDPAALIATVVGSLNSPVATACLRRFVISARTRVAEVSPVLIITTAGMLPPGKAFCIWSYTFITGIVFGNVSGPGVTVCMCSAGAASATSAPPATIVAIIGWPRTGLR